jgi:hypothetical protein
VEWSEREGEKKKRNKKIERKVRSDVCAGEEKKKKTEKKCAECKC